MRRKILQDYSNTLCHMLIGSRISGDLEVLADLPDGSLSIDVLRGTASHDVAGSLQLQVAGELRDWLVQRLEVSGIPTETISSAAVTARITTDRIATDRTHVVSFDFFVRSTLTTEHVAYLGQPHEVHKWHSRLPRCDAKLCPGEHADAHATGGELSEVGLVQALDRADELVRNCAAGSLSFEEFCVLYDNFYWLYALDGHESDESGRATLARLAARIAPHKVVAETILHRVCADADATRQGFRSAGRISGSEAVAKLKELAQALPLPQGLPSARVR